VGWNTAYESYRSSLGLGNSGLGADPRRPIRKKNLYININTYIGVGEWGRDGDYAGFPPQSKKNYIFFSMHSHGFNVMY